MLKVLSLLLLVFSTSIMASGSIEVSNPVVRLTPPGSAVTAIFLKMKNTSDKDMKLVKVTGDKALTFELHNMEMQNGRMIMRRVEGIDIKARSEALLASGGLHIMVFNLKRPLVEGASFPVKLHFKDNSEVSIEAIVKKL